MADKQFARSGTTVFDIAEDDPLSELARIVGYEDKQPVVLPEPESVLQPSAIQRPEPVFGLEDELMRAFEAYDAPRFDPVKSVADRLVERQPEPSFEQEAFIDIPEVEPQTSATERDTPEPATFIEPVLDISEDDDVAVEAAVSEPDFDLAGRADLAFEPEAAESVAEPDAHVDEEQLLHPESDVDAVDAPAVTPEQAALQSVPVADGNGDLERELELSIGYDAPDDLDLSEGVVEAAVVNDDVNPSFQSRDESAGSSAAQDLENWSWQDSALLEEELVTASDAPSFSGEETPQVSSDIAPYSSKQDVFIEPRQAASFDSVDALLDEVDQFPVVPAAAAGAASLASSAVQPRATEQVRKNNYPFTPTFGRATPVAMAGGSAVSSAFATPLSQSRVAPPIETPVFEEPAALEPVQEQPTQYEGAGPQLDLSDVTITPAVAETVLDKTEAEFDLDNFDLDLSDIDLDIEPDDFDMSGEVFAEEPAAPVHAVVEPVVQAPSDPVEVVEEQSLPFDPTLIADAGETVSPIAEMNVPHLPPVEKERPSSYQQDYDFDIDTEMQQLFGTVAPAADGRQASVASATGAVVADPLWAAAREQVERQQSAASDGLDDFERALEEDFRRSLSEPRNTASVLDPNAVAPAYMDDEDEPRRRLPVAVMAIAAAAVLIVGAGVYAFVGGDSGAVSGDGPQIILADKEPVKVVPEEKGGKTVPNQDKAVYDRVAGNQNTTPSQETLVSTTEEPVDVVQRTLAPETLPLEGAEDGASFTGLDDEADARLLPDGDIAQDDAAAEAKTTPGVSPRKVRTMIVKPDGTLVAREEPVAEEQPQMVAATPETATQTITPQRVTTQPVTTTNTPVGTQENEVALAQPEDIQASGETQQVSALAEAANAVVENTAPVRTVKTTTVGEQTPVPGTRPSEQEVNVVGTVTERGNVRQNAQATTPATETATNQTATSTQAAVQTPETQVAAVNPGEYVIQIASLPSEADANASYKNLSAKFSSVIGGRGVDIRKAEIAGKGTYYRVRIPAGSRADANTLCSRYKSAGGSCLVTR